MITDINLDNGTITIPEGTRTNERIIPLDAKQMMPIIQYISLKKGEKLFDARMQDMLRQLNKNLSLKGSTIHTGTLRTSRIVLWLKHYNVRKVQYLGGFRYLSSLDKYRINEVDNLRKKLESCFNL